MAEHCHSKNLDEMQIKILYVNYIYSIFNYINKEIGKSDITYTLIEARLSGLTDDGKIEIKYLFGKNVLLD